MQLLTVRVSHRKKSDRSGHCHSFAEWVPNISYAQKRFWYTFRRQMFMSYDVDDQGVLSVQYWGPVTMRRAMKVVKAIPVHPNAPFGQRTV